jgi:selenocysteine-specific elongation factor
MEEPEPHKRLEALVEHAALGVDLKTYRLAFNLGPDDITFDASVHRVCEGRTEVAFSAVHWKTLCAQLLSALAKFHDEHPKEAGVDLERLRRMAFPQLTGAVAAAVAVSLVKDGRITRSGNVWHLATHDLSSSEKNLADRVLPLLDAGRFDPPQLGEISSKVGACENDVRDLLMRLAR